jgi:alkylation response protein AidB-like acyl-CoA dehydrogenase
MKQKYMPDVAAGKTRAAFALTEANAGSDASGIQTTAVLDGDEWVLNGTKNFITNASHAQFAVVLAVSDRENTRRGVTAFGIEMSQAGIRAGKKENKLGMRTSDTAELILENCRVPHSQVLGEVGHGFIDAMKVLDGGRISIAALALGIARGAYDAALKYASERQAFGKPIAHFQAIQFMLADMATEIEAARLLVYQAAKLKDLGQPYAIQASKGKLYASEAAHRACHKAIQIHGGYGYSREFPVERFMRDAKLTEIGEGTSEVQRMIIGRDLLKTTEKEMR